MRIGFIEDWLGQFDDIGIPDPHLDLRHEPFRRHIVYRQKKLEKNTGCLLELSRAEPQIHSKRSHENSNLLGSRWALSDQKAWSG